MDNFAPHLLFPFHYADFALYYACFGLRMYTTFRWGSVPLIILLQVNVILKNSGTYEGAVHWVRHKLFPKAVDSSSGDALLKLQFLARLAIQYDLADLTAIATVPSLVSLLVWRDGWFSLDGTGLIVLPCDLPSLWGNFCILLVIKPFSFLCARKLLEAKMSRTLLGKEVQCMCMCMCTCMCRARCSERRCARPRRCMRMCPVPGMHVHVPHATCACACVSMCMPLLGPADDPWDLADRTQDPASPGAHADQRGEEARAGWALAA